MSDHWDTDRHEQYNADQWSTDRSEPPAVGPPRRRLSRAARAQERRAARRRRVLSIGTEQLTMTAAEGRALLGAEGVELSVPVGDALVRRTEGWPAGLYLAALALRQQGFHGLH